MQKFFAENIAESIRALEMNFFHDDRCQDLGKIKKKFKMFRILQGVAESKPFLIMYEGLTEKSIYDDGILD